jgi:hypothetical protein
MSFANTTGRSEWSVNAGKAYISTDVFNNEFYTYTVSTTSNFQTIGTLTLVSSSAAACPGGRQLVLNGRKLTPGANPMNFITGAAVIGNNPFVYGSSGTTLVALSATGNSASTGGGPFVPRFMVGVADVVSGLNGFIDPTNVLFAQYDKNRPVTDYIIDMTTGLSVDNAVRLSASGQSDRINTKASLMTVAASTVNIGASSAGQLLLPSTGTGTTSQITVTSSVITPATTPVILLTLVGANGLTTAANGAPYLTSVNTATGTFVVNVVNTTAGNYAPTVNFLIIN